MNRPHFEITFIPKDTKVVPRFYRKLNNTEDFEDEVKSILAASKIVAEKVEIARTKVKSKSDWLKDFNSCRVFSGNIKGIKKGLFRGKKWKADFSLQLLYGKKRDGIMFRAEEGGKEMQEIGERVYDRIIESIAKHNEVVPWSEITRVGTINQRQVSGATKGFRVKEGYVGTWAPALQTKNF